MTTIRLTMAQALVRFLVAQNTEIDGQEVPLFAGVFAIFGHGNVAGLGEALYQARDRLPTLRAHNEQAMALAAIAFAKASRRRRMMACTSSIGPGATNMVTAAAVAHANRLPVLLLPGDIFAGRRPDPVGLGEAAAMLAGARAPLIVVGGGVHYALAAERLGEFAERHDIPVAETQAGKGAIAWDHYCAVGAIGVTGSSAANALAAEADVILAVGTRLADFTTASRSLFRHSAARLIQLNVAAFDAAKHGAVPLVADARVGPDALGAAAG